jgi:hypothetical protein
MTTTELRSPHEAAILLAVLFRRSGQKRGRLSQSTVKLAGDRLRLKGAYLEAVQDHLEKFGLVLIDLPNGGLAIWPTSTLEGAPAITFKRYMPGEIDKLRRNPAYISKLAEELEPDETQSDEAED